MDQTVSIGIRWKEFLTNSKRVRDPFTGRQRLITPGGRRTIQSTCGSFARLDTNGPLPSFAVGLVMYFAYLLYPPCDFVSNPISVEIVP